MPRIAPGRCRCRRRRIAARRSGIGLMRDVASRGPRSSGTFVCARDSIPSEILPRFPASFRAGFEAILAKQRIAVFAGKPVTRRRSRPPCAPTRRHRSRPMKSCGRRRRRPHHWLAGTGLPVDQRGFLRVERRLARGRTGRCVRGWRYDGFRRRELPKSGVYAVRAGPVLADNIRRTLRGERAAPVRAAAPGAVSRLDRGALCAWHPQRSGRSRGLGLALEGLDRSPVHGQVQ